MKAHTTHHVNIQFLLQQQQPSLAGRGRLAGVTIASRGLRLLRARSRLLALQELEDLRELGLNLVVHL